MIRRLLRMPEVQSATGLKRSTIYRKIAKGEFPPPVKNGCKFSGWIEDEISAYNEKRIAARDGEAA